MLLDNLCPHGITNMMPVTGTWHCVKHYCYRQTVSMWIYLETERNTKSCKSTQSHVHKHVLHQCITQRKNAIQVLHSGSKYALQEKKCSIASMYALCALIGRSKCLAKSYGTQHCFAKLKQHVPIATARRVSLLCSQLNTHFLRCCWRCCGMPAAPLHSSKTQSAVKGTSTLGLSCMHWHSVRICFYAPLHAHAKPARISCTAESPCLTGASSASPSALPTTPAKQLAAPAPCQPIAHRASSWSLTCSPSALPQCRIGAQSCHISPRVELP